MIKEKRFWIGLSLVNLVLVALFGLLMRSKMLFSIPIIDYRNILSAHSHFAFAGWVGLGLIALLVYDVLPIEQSQRKFYQIILWGIEISSVGMALSFPFFGYNFFSIFFSTLYILVTYVFGWVFFKDLKKATIHPVVKRLSIGAVTFLILSSIGPAGLSYIIITKSSNSLLYRDSIYTFLHLQYNGFFTLAVFAAFFSYWIKKGFLIPPAAKRFVFFLLASVLPSLFLALLWHNLIIFYIIAAIGCLCILLSAYFFLPVFRYSLQKTFFDSSIARTIWTVSFVSFIVKMVLTVGTVYPPLGHAVYGARPVIIGFLHLVFLAFVSCYLLSNIIQEGYFTVSQKVVAYPFYLFGLGVIANEVLLMIQGLEILLKTNNPIYSRLLWGVAIVLLAGALTLAFEFYRRQRVNKKAAVFTTAS